MEYANIRPVRVRDHWPGSIWRPQHGWAVDVLPTPRPAQARAQIWQPAAGGGDTAAPSILCNLTPQDAPCVRWPARAPTVLLDNCVPNASVEYRAPTVGRAWELNVRHLAGWDTGKSPFLNGTRDSMVSEERRLGFPAPPGCAGLSHRRTDDGPMGIMNKTAARIRAAFSYGARQPSCAPATASPEGCWPSCGAGPARARGRGVMGYDDLTLAAGCGTASTTIRQDSGLALGKGAFSLLDSPDEQRCRKQVLLRRSPESVPEEKRPHGPAPVAKQARGEKQKGAHRPFRLLRKRFFAPTLQAGMQQKTPGCQRQDALSARRSLQPAAMRIVPPLPPQPIRWSVPLQRVHPPSQLPPLGGSPGTGSMLRLARVPPVSTNTREQAST